MSAILWMLLKLLEVDYDGKIESTQYFSACKILYHLFVVWGAVTMIPILISYPEKSGLCNERNREKCRVQVFKNVGCDTEVTSMRFHLTNIGLSFNKFGHKNKQQQIKLSQ